MDQMTATIITSVSLVTAFFGGMVALFAPCCITFLLPSYLGNIFRSKANVVGGTFLFGLGLATILVPTALGIRAIGQVFQQFHTQTYVIGGIFMILLGAMELTGKKITLPMIHLTIDLSAHKSPWAVYILGVFSGITSSCCTPVLAGILTLSFLSPTFFWAGLAGVSYVLGMLVPLVILAIFIEKINWNLLPALRTKTIRIGTKQIPTTDVIAGILFMTTGIVFSILALTGNITMGTEQPIEQTLGPTLMGVVRTIREIPGSEAIFAFLVVLAVVYISIRFLKGRRKT